VQAEHDYRSSANPRHAVHAGDSSQGGESTSIEGVMACLSALHCDSSKSMQKVLTDYGPAPNDEGLTRQAAGHFPASTLAANGLRTPGEGEPFCGSMPCFSLLRGIGHCLPGLTMFRIFASLIGTGRLLRFSDLNGPESAQSQQIAEVSLVPYLYTLLSWIAPPLGYSICVKSQLS
jgi:hypothetical protein